MTSINDFLSLMSGIVTIYAMGAVVVGVNGVVYAVLWRRGALRRRTLI